MEVDKVANEVADMVVDLEIRVVIERVAKEEGDMKRRMNMDNRTWRA